MVGLKMDNERNIFLVTVDGLRFDRLSHFGNERLTSPRIDSLADEGAVCWNNIATATGTRPSFPGILTSSYPLMYGGYAQMTKPRVPISEAFREYGYTTLGINTNAQLHTRFGWDRGFDVYYDSERVTVNRAVGDFRYQEGDKSVHDRSAFEATFDHLRSEAYGRLNHDGYLYQTLESVYRVFEGRSPPHDRAEDTVDRTLSFIDRAPDEAPLFVWIHFMETHSPYFPPERYREKFLTTDVSDGRIWSINDRLHEKPASLTDEEVGILSDLYDASLRYLDDQLDRLFDGFRERGLWDESIVAFTADHGEQFREHGEMTHCSEPWEEGVHVPLVIRVGNEELDDVDRVTSTIDIGPTLFDATLGTPDVSERHHGISLLPVLRGDDELSSDRAVFSQSAAETEREIHLCRRLTGLRTDRWKFITSVDDSTETKLYDLRTDPDEQKNVATDHPDLVAEFQACVDEQYRLDAYTEFEIRDAVDTGAVSDRLQALGYLDH